MRKKAIFIVLILGIATILMACNTGNDTMEEPEDVNGMDQPQPGPADPEEDERENGEETGMEIYTVKARLIGLADANSGEFEILESQEYHFEQELNVFRFGEEVIEDFNEEVFEVDDVLTLYISIEQGEDYNIYTIERAQPRD